MKLKQIVLLLLICSFGCKKSPAKDSSQQCYTCQVYDNYGGPVKAKDTCLPKGVAPVFKDAQGNSVNYSCTEK